MNIPSRQIERQIAGAGQAGVALVFSLIILLLLTILGLSALRTSSLEQLMSGNTQDMTRAFEAADIGIKKSLQPGRMPTSPSTFTYVASDYTFTGMNATAEPSVPSFVQIAPPPISSIANSKNVCFSYYNQQVTGKTTSYARSDLYQTFISQGAPCDTNP